MTENIKEIIKSLIENLGVLEAAIDVSEKDAVIMIDINSPEEHSLIGRNNEKFEAFSHILKRIIAKNHGEELKVVIDINGQRAKNEIHIKNRASMMAERARAFKIDVELDPMSSYERMIIHSHLEGSPNVKTESVGEGKERRLVIRYIEDNKSLEA